MLFTELHTKVEKNYLKTKCICLCDYKDTIYIKSHEIIIFTTFSPTDLSFELPLNFQ